MIIHKDNEYNFIEKVDKKYKMYINGWYAGGFSCRKIRSDTKAIEIYKRIKKFETEA